MSPEVLYLDEFLVVVNKPAGLLVHPSALDRAETQSAMKLLRARLGRKVYPVHRLDRPTSGVLLFALSPDIATALAAQFERHEVRKGYLAVVRGFPALGGIIRHPLSIRDDLQSRRAVEAEPQTALTLYHRLGTVALDVRVDDRYPSSRYALVACWPRTGRRHQLRRHLKHISHPIIGDTTYGKGSHNRFFEERFGQRRLYLHAGSLEYTHPTSRERLEVTAPLPGDFATVCDQLGLGPASTDPEP